jgi:hypothetical protein
MHKPALALLFLLLAGCAAPPSHPLHAAAVDQAAAPADDGLVATATRVVPVRTLLDQHGRFDDQVVCSGTSTSSCLTQGGVAARPYLRNVTNPDALFWRANLTVDWTSVNPHSDHLRLLVKAVKPCGDGRDCVKVTRTVAKASGDSPLLVPTQDLFLRPGETGMQVRLELNEDNMTGMAVGPLDVQYHLHGWLAGYVAAAPPQTIVLQAQPAS